MREDIEVDELAFYKITIYFSMSKSRKHGVENMNERTSIYSSGRLGWVRTTLPLETMAIKYQVKTNNFLSIWQSTVKFLSQFWEETL